MFPIKRLEERRGQIVVSKKLIVVPTEKYIFTIFEESGPNSDSKFLVGRKEPTRVSGFVLIRLGARAMKQ